MRTFLIFEIHTSCHSKKKEKLYSLDDDHDAVLSGQGTTSLWNTGWGKTELGVVYRNNVYREV